MHKIISLSLLVFFIMPIHTMIHFTPTFSLLYKRDDSSHKRLTDISQDVFLHYFFPADNELNELITLIKKIGFNDASTELMHPIREHFLPIVYLSQTNKYFHSFLNEEIKKRTSLKYVSCNSISLYNDGIGQYRTPIIMFNCDSTKNNDLIFCICLNRLNEEGKFFQIYNKNELLKFYLLCNTIKDTYAHNEEIKNICSELQEQWKKSNTVYEVTINSLRDLLAKYSENDILDEVSSGYLKLAKFVCPIVFTISIKTNNASICKNIETSLCKNQEPYISIFSLCPQRPDKVLEYLNACDSFLERLRASPTKKVQNNETTLTIEIDCGLSNDPIIPVDIICPQWLTITDLLILR